MIRVWRTGSVTLGLCLVAGGIALLWGKISGLFGILSVLKFWPILLILLGIEILLYSIIGNTNKVKFVADGASIFFIIVIIIFSLLMASINSFSEMAGIRDALNEIATRVH